MLSLDAYLREAERAHGHICAGQVLGVRLAMLGLEKLGIEDPRGKDRKRLITFVEIDRCATDAIAVVTGCRLGKRALKFRDWEKWPQPSSISLPTSKKTGKARPQRNVATVTNGKGTTLVVPSQSATGAALAAEDNGRRP